MEPPRMGGGGEVWRWRPVKGGGEIGGRLLGLVEAQRGWGEARELLICAAMPDCSSHVSCAAPNSAEIWASQDALCDTACRRCHCPRTDLADDARLWTRVREWTDDRGARRRRLRGHASDENNNRVTVHRKHQGEFLTVHAAVLFFCCFFCDILWSILNVCFIRRLKNISGLRWFEHVWHLSLESNSRMLSH